MGKVKSVKNIYLLTDHKSPILDKFAVQHYNWTKLTIDEAVRNQYYFQAQKPILGTLILETALKSWVNFYLNLFSASSLFPDSDPDTCLPLGSIDSESTACACARVSKRQGGVLWRCKVISKHIKSVHHPPPPFLQQHEKKFESRSWDRVGPLFSPSKGSSVQIM